MLLSEHVYCVAVSFKMTEWVEQQICIRFCIKLEQYSLESIQIMQKATAMGNWWLVASSWWHAHSCITSRAEFFDKISNHPGELIPLEPRFDTQHLLAFPNTKITFERKNISGHLWDSWKYNGAADSNWENCVRSQGDFSEGDWVSYIFFSKCLYFSYDMAGYLLDRLYTHTHT